MKIADFIQGFIGANEGGLSTDAADNGNWTGGHRGVGKLVGSKYGVTAGALAAFRGVPALSITAADIRAVTVPLAVQIGVHIYYEAPGFNKLPWNRVTASIVDKGWGSGPEEAIRLMQRMVGLVGPRAADGKIGPQTVVAYTAWLAGRSEEDAAKIWAQVRLAFDASIGQPKYINGWNNRTRSFLPGTPWWKAWT